MLAHGVEFGLRPGNGGGDGASSFRGRRRFAREHLGRELALAGELAARVGVAVFLERQEAYNDEHGEGAGTAHDRGQPHEAAPGTRSSMFSAPTAAFASMCVQSTPLCR